MIANARGSNFINFDILNTKNIGENSQELIDKMIEDIKISIEAINKMSELNDTNDVSIMPNISHASNDYVLVNPTLSNDPKSTAEYNRGFVMGVKCSFVAAGSVVAAGYLIKGAEELYKKVRKKNNKEEQISNNNQVIQQNIVQTTPIEQQVPVQNQQQIVNNIIQ